MNRDKLILELQKKIAYYQTLVNKAKALKYFKDREEFNKGAMHALTVLLKEINPEKTEIDNQPFETVKAGGGWYAD